MLTYNTKRLHFALYTIHGKVNLNVMFHAENDIKTISIIWIKNPFIKVLIKYD